MRTITGMVLLCVCAWRCAGVESARRRDYEPYMFAAVPLHSPVPVLRVLSPAPLAVPPPPGRRAPPRPYASPVQLTPFTRPYTDRPYSERPYYDRPYADRPYTDRPYSDRPYADHSAYAESRPYSDVRPYTDSRPYGETRLPHHSESRPFSDVRHLSEGLPFSEVLPFSKIRPHGESRPYSGARPYVETVEYYDESAPASQRPAASSADFALDGWDSYVLPVVGASSLPHAVPLEEDGSSEAAVLYARPSLAGGYTYRKLAKKPPKKAAPAKDQPVLVKIHKHRIIKS